MVKPVLALTGLVLLCFPRRIAEFGERLAIENPDDAAMRWTTLPAARVEGLLAVWIALRGRWPVALATPLGLTGASLVVAPERALRTGLAMAYRNPDRIETKPWVRPLTRFVGIAHLAVAFGIRLRSDGGDLDR